MSTFIQKSLIVAGLSMLIASTANADNRYSSRDSHQYRKHASEHRVISQRHTTRRYEPRRQNKKHDDKKLFAGLLVGALLGYAILDSQRVTQQRPVRQPVSLPLAQPEIRFEPQASQCLQQREYTMKVLINGKLVDAYGTACLQPDGSWKQGPLSLPEVVSQRNGLRF